MKYFDLWDDRTLRGRWHLRSPVNARREPVDPWQFKQGRPLNISEKIHFPVRPAGSTLEFTLSSFTIPVVSGRVVSLLHRLGLQGSVQFIAADVEGQGEPYFILNALQIIDCVDDTRCEFVERWRPEDGQPEKIGMYQNIRGLRVDPGRAIGADIFRPRGWTVALIVSERVKLAMEEADVIGPRFTEV
jgi:hypothetical protein